MDDFGAFKGFGGSLSRHWKRRCGMRRSSLNSIRHLPSGWRNSTSKAPVDHSAGQSIETSLHRLDDCTNSSPTYRPNNSSGRSGERMLNGQFRGVLTATKIEFGGAPRYTACRTKDNSLDQKGPAGSES